MRKVTVTKLGVGSFAKVVGITQAVLAFVVGVIVSLAVAAELITESSSFVNTLGVGLWALGLGAIIYPLIAFVIGWVQGAIVAMVINFAFAESNGLTLEIEETK